MIYDLNDNPLTAAQAAVELGESFQATIRVECRANYFLRAGAVAGLLIESRRIGSASWTNLETDGIALGGYAGTRQNFQVRVTSDGDVAPDRLVCNLRVSL